MEASLRMSPTQKQAQKLEQLDDEALLPRALDAMHALNRRAKEKRDRRNKYKRTRFSERISEEIDDIYDLKNRFLGALVNAGVARVFAYEWPGRTLRPEWECRCGHTWVGHDGECYRCGDYGQEIDPGGPTSETWYLIVVGGHRFHQPADSATDRMREIAESIEPHDPDQPQREIPSVGLTIEAQRQCVEMMIRRLTERAEHGAQ